MKIGVLKSKVEKLLSESYGKGTFKEEIRNFNKNVLSNKNISKLFFLYDTLSSKNGLDRKIAEDYVLESITMFENIINTTDRKDLEKLKKWVIGVNSHNSYNDIDNLFYGSSDVLHLENKVRSKQRIIEGLIRPTIVEDKEPIMLPLSSMVKVANKTIDDFISNLSESDKKELTLLLKEDESKLIDRFNSLKDDATVKLIFVMENEPSEDIKNTILETIDNIKSKKFDRLEYFRLKNLVDNL